MMSPRTFSYKVYRLLELTTNSLSYFHWTEKYRNTDYWRITLLKTSVILCWLNSNTYRECKVHINFYSESRLFLWLEIIIFTEIEQFVQLFLFSDRFHVTYLKIRLCLAYNEFGYKQHKIKVSNFYRNTVWMHLKVQKFAYTEQFLLLSGSFNESQNGPMQSWNVTIIVVVIIIGIGICRWPPNCSFKDGTFVKLEMRFRWFWATLIFQVD